MTVDAGALQPWAAPTKGPDILARLLELERFCASLQLLLSETAVAAPAALTENKVPVADANGDLEDSTITDDGTDVSITGKLGIGTVSPSEELVVESPNVTRVVASDTGTGGNNYPGFQMENEGDFKGGFFFNEASQTVEIWESGLAISINATGHVVIGKTLTVDGVLTAVITITSNLTVDDTHEVVLVDASSGPVTVTLPTAVGITGRRYNIKKIDSSGNNVSVAADGSETIEGGPTISTTTEGLSWTVSSDNENWDII